MNNRFIRRFTGKERGMSLSTMNNLIDKVNANEVIFDKSHFTVRGGPWGKMVSLCRFGGAGGSGTGIGNELCSFGIGSIDHSARSVTIRPGYVFWGRNPGIPISGQTVYVLGGTASQPVYAYLSFTWNTKTGSIGSSTVYQLPTSDTTALYVTLASFYISSNNLVVVKNIHWQGDLLFPGTFA